MRFVLVFTAFATTAGAEIRIPPAEFEALSEGRTLHFQKLGQPYGSEQYGPNRNVIWQFANGACEIGYWVPDGKSICFYYEGQLDKLCWSFVERDGKKRARIAGTEAGDVSEITLTGIDDARLECPGPDLGM